MGYRELYESLNKRERFVIDKLMGLMKTDDLGYWTVCFTNMVISKIASLILGENVFDWLVRMISKLNEPQDEKDATITEIGFLKELLA